MGSINLAEFVKNPYTGDAYFDFEDFKKTVKIAIRALDEVLDYGVELHALPEQREMARNYRNIGLGIMGLGSMLFKMGIKYGDDDSLSLVHEIGNMMFREAVRTSVELAKVKGTFPKYKESMFESRIMKNHFSASEIEEMKQFGMRNCSLLSIAPSGSIGTMLNVTTGCEPAFRISYKRKTESLHKDEEVYYDVLINEAKEYKALHPNEELPDYFVASNDIAWVDRIKMQAALQFHIDTAISSTVNLPNSATIEDVEELYRFAWETGLKGVTIFRDGCKRDSVLSTTDKKNNEQEQSVLPRGFIVQASDNCVGKKRKLQTGCGSLHCQAFFDKTTGDLMETYLSKGSTGGCLNFMTGLSRMISLAARAGIKVDDIVDQLNSCGTCPSYAVRRATHHDTSKGSCCPTAVGNALIDMWNEMQNETKNEQPVVCNKTEEDKPQIAVCPECGEPIIHSSGCVSCTNCSWTKCD